jgi:hypothetical protein
MIELKISDACQNCIVDRIYKKTTLLALLSTKKGTLNIV